MENFGLGLVLNFQDNATSKIDSVIGMMENLQKSINQVANSAPATVREFSVRFIPNYSVVAADALRDPWSLFVRLSNVGI